MSEEGVFLEKDFSFLLYWSIVVSLLLCCSSSSGRPGSYKEGNSSDQADWSPVNNSLQD